MFKRIESYFNILASLPLKTIVTKGENEESSLEKVFSWATKAILDTHANGNKVMFIGNGGSAGIASHMAIDYTKNGNIRSTAFNDGAALTCLGNDLGYDQVFAKQIEMHARQGDFLVAISSSGRSANILNAVIKARSMGCNILTLSGFKSDNPLRTMGDYNLFVNNHEYGFVEITHLALCHAILDLAMGWTNQKDAA